MRTLRLYGSLSIAALWALSGCGDPFTAGPASSTSTSSASGTGGAGGAGGEGGEGGEGGASATSSSSSASGGGGAGGCAACKAGEFCTASETCVRCTDRSRALSFGALERIDVAGRLPAFPRVRVEPGVGGEGGTVGGGGAGGGGSAGGAGGGGSAGGGGGGGGADGAGGEDGVSLRLVYVASFGSSSDRQIATAIGRPWGGGAVIESALVNTAQLESGPLLLPLDALSPSDAFPPGSLLFDRFLPGPGSPQKLFIADELEATSVVPFEVLNRDWGSHSVAVAHAARPYRYWFMNKHQDGSGITSQLVTMRAHDAAPQALDILLPGDCPAQGDDLAPWVTPDGGVLFFQAPYSPHGDCAGASVVRSFYVKLGPDGLPLNGEKARLLLSSVGPNRTVMTPSLSPDECTLYIASDNDGEQKLYAAPRR